MGLKNEGNEESNYIFIITQKIITFENEKYVSQS